MARHEWLHKDSGAQFLHSEGLERVSAERYDKAHESFAQARSLIETNMRMRKYDRLSLTDVSVQIACITRDDGFTYARQAAKAKKPKLLETANEKLEESMEATHILVGGMRGAMDGSPEVFEPNEREILAEYGATISMMGRVATIDMMLHGGNQNEEAIGSAMAYYHEADSFLHHGDNGYYLVSNAMVAARQKRLDNRNTTPWLKRAAYGLARTAVHDKVNRKAATRTFVSRMRHLRSYQAAIDSVTESP